MSPTKTNLIYLIHSFDIENEVNEVSRLGGRLATEVVLFYVNEVRMRCFKGEPLQYPVGAYLCRYDALGGRGIGEKMVKELEPLDFVGGESGCLCYCRHRNTGLFKVAGDFDCFFDTLF